MRLMFEYSGFNQDISSWDVSSVSNMEAMFYGATSFNQDISNWDISSVIYMGGMLYEATSFNQDLCAWGDKFPYDNALDIFDGSGCTFQETPQESQQGPFCASSCGITVPPSTSPSSSLAPTTAFRPSSSPTETCWWVEVTIVFDQWASQTSWDVQRINAVGDNTILKEFIGTDSDDSETRQESICLQEGEHQFTIYDSAGDGIFDPGYYNVTSYGEIIKEGGVFVSNETTVFSIPFVAP
jgi:surface protein